MYQAAALVKTLSATDEAYRTGRPVHMMDKAIALPTSPQALQRQQDVISRILAARPDTGIHLNFAAKLSNYVGPPQSELLEFACNYL